jgi:ribose 1,5-bisphosphokinase PhnN
VWGLGYLHELTINRQDGVIIVASLLLFPSTLLVYGVASMIFAAKEAIEKRARQKGREEGREEGRRQALKAERKRIEQELAALENSGVLIPPEIVRIITRESTPRS